MEPEIFCLYLLCSLAGFIMVAGGIWLIYKQKIYIDRESKQVTEIETPMGKFKTNVPALVLFALGFFPLVFPIYRIEKLGKEIPVTGNLKADVFPVMVYAVVRSDTLLGPGGYSLQVPGAGGGECKILYVAGSSVAEARADLTELKDGKVVLPEKEILAVVPAYKANALPPVPSEFK